MPIAYGDLTTLADVKAWLSLGQQPMPPTDDGLLTRLITAASQFIQTWLNRPLGSSDWQEVRDGRGAYLNPYDARFQFAVQPVTAVILVAVLNQVIPPIPAPSFVPLPGGTLGTPETVTFTPQITLPGYTFSPSQLIIRGYGIPRLAQCVTIQYTAGYDPIPADVQQACIELVAWKYHERRRIGETTRSIGGVEVATFQPAAFSLRDMRSDIQTLLMQYRMVAPVSATLTQMAPNATSPALLVGAV